MNQRSDIDRLLRHWMDDGPTRMPDRIVDVVADRISVQRQQRSWRLLRRLPMNPLLKVGAAAAAVLAVAILGYNLLPGLSGPGASATPSRTPGSSPSVGVEPSPTWDTSLPAITDAPLAGGRYLLRPFVDLPTLAFSADLPARWHGVPPVGAIGPTGPDGPSGIALGTLRVDALFGDPCHWDLDGTGNTSQPGDVEVGPGNSDLVEALQANTAYASSEDSWAGFPQPESGIGETVGHSMQIRLPESLDIGSCDVDSEGESRYYVFSGPDAGLYAQGSGNIWDLAMVEIGGSRVIVVLSYFEGTPIADLEAGQSILRSLDFKP